MATRKKAGPAVEAAVEQPAAPIVIGWKGFDKNLQCRGYQFTVGGTYTHKGLVEACSGGFHACENPLDVWSYYGLEDGNRFARVVCSGTISRHNGDTKFAAEVLTVETEVTLGEMIKAGVQYVVAATKGQGDNPAGNYAQIGSSGDSARIGSSGDSARIGSSGNYAQIGSGGDYARIGSSGDYARIGSSGDSARIGSSGDYARIGSSGNYAQIGSGGDYARIGSSGDYARIGSSGDYGVIATAGYDAQAKGADGTWLSLAEYDRNGKCVGFATGCIGADGLKADTYYRAQGGKLVEAA